MKRFREKEEKDIWPICRIHKYRRFEAEWTDRNEKREKEEEKEKRLLNGKKNVFGSTG